MKPDEIEKLAIKHETFGFGHVDARGLTTHGFDPEGLQAFVNELLAQAQKMPADKAEGDAQDAARLEWLDDNHIDWYPPGYNGNPVGRFDLYWPSEQKDLRTAIDAAMKKGQP